MDLKGKKIVFLGDSITEGLTYGISSMDKVYWNVIARKSGAECFGHGIGGTRIAPQRVPSPTPRHDIYFGSRVHELNPDADIVVIFGGTNDYGHGDAAMGKPGDTGEDTFCGAYYVLVNDVKAQCPNANIVAMTPIHRESEQRLYNARGVRCAGTLTDYVNAIMAVAKLTGIKCVNMLEKYPVDPNVTEQKELYCPDGLHPNDAGHEILGNCLLDFLTNEI